jgi:CTP synthase
MEPWEELVDRIKHPTDEITIHVVGKYTGYEDSYKSLNEALYHGGFAHRARIIWHIREYSQGEKVPTRLQQIFHSFQHLPCNPLLQK